MALLQAVQIEISDSIHSILKKEIERHGLSEQIKSRIRIILLAHSGLSNNKIVKQTGHGYQKVKDWRDLWHKEYAALLKAYETTGSRAAAHRLVLSFFQDAPRSGTPKKIGYEVVQKVMAIACSKPTEFGIPRTTWNRDLIAQTVIEEGIIERISGSYVSVLLKKTK
jgi:putative transposase